MARTTPVQEIRPEHLPPVERLNRDMKNSAKLMTDTQARALVDQYYAIQKLRVSAGNQGFALAKTEEPHEVATFINQQLLVLEGQIKLALNKFAEAQPEGRWLLSQVGIGPVIAAGLIAYIPPRFCDKTAGKVWKLAGMVPGQKRVRGEKLGYNPALKKLLYLAGESLVKVSGKDDAFYAKLYLQRKAYEQAKNEKKEYSDQAEAALTNKKYSKDTEAYKAYIQGKLPDGQIHARSKRWAVKMLLSHFAEIRGAIHFPDVERPAIYALAHLQHVDYIAPPNWPMSDEKPAPKTKATKTMKLKKRA